MLLMFVSSSPYLYHVSSTVIYPIYNSDHAGIIMKKALLYIQLTLFVSVLLYFGKTLFIPLFMGFLIAIVMYPVAKRLEKAGLNKALSITSCLIIVGILFGILFALFIWQLNVFSQDAPLFLQKLEKVLASLQEKYASWLGPSVSAQEINWNEKLTNSVGGILKDTVAVTVNTLFILFLTPVYTALILYHRQLFVRFLVQVTPSRYQEQLDAIIKQTIHTYFNFIKGMVWVYLVVGVLNSIGLLALGVDHAILFGMLCAIMTIIPYAGIIISSLLPITVVWMSTGNIWYPAGVVAWFAFVQYLEANVIFPRIVGTELHVSTMAILLASIAGGIIWGVAGMVLFIPFVAILKIITEHIEEWKPLNTLISRK